MENGDGRFKLFPRGTIILLDLLLKRNTEYCYRLCLNVANVSAIISF